MIDIQQFENIKEKHGSYASWGVWADASEKPKSNIGDVSHFKTNSVLSLLKNNVVMVGLNISRPVLEPFINFHDPNPRANDFKIRYAFKDSAYLKKSDQVVRYQDRLSPTSDPCREPARSATIPSSSLSAQPPSRRSLPLNPTQTVYYVATRAVSNRSTSQPRRRLTGLAIRTGKLLHPRA